VIGPEGDLLKREKRNFTKRKGLKVSKKILRSETASLFCASVVASFLENE
jgi:16S rRNA U1498 N3-methylase RsmE